MDLSISLYGQPFFSSILSILPINTLVFPDSPLYILKSRSLLMTGWVSPHVIEPVWLYYRLGFLYFSLINNYTMNNLVLKYFYIVRIVIVILMFSC